MRAAFDEQGSSSSLEDTTTMSKSSSWSRGWKRFVEFIEGRSDVAFFAFSEKRAEPALLLLLPFPGLKETSCHSAVDWVIATELTIELL
jgi:hypothetical protein